MPIRIAIIGLGKISVDQHVPSILANEDFQLVAGVSPRSRVAGIPVYSDLASALAQEEFDAVVVNTQPQVRCELARQAMAAGKHVLLEKPPAASLSALADLEGFAREEGVSIYTAWHSQHAPAVPPARAWLAGRLIHGISMRWRENVREWHPGQRWIWEPGGLGVFDPGINGLSILSRILPERLVIEGARLDLPRNCATPIAAELFGRVGCNGSFHAELDFLQLGEQTWSIDIQTNAGELSLRMGGSELFIGGEPQATGPSEEYPSIYRTFARLVQAGECEVDSAPLALTADAFLVGSRHEVADFYE